MTDTPDPVVVKAFALVEAILAANRPLTLSELSEALDRPKQTIHRTARQLEDYGFLYREPGRERYTIGGRLFNVSKQVLGWQMRAAPRHATLGRLVSDVGETCNVGIMDGDAILYLDRVESNFPLRAELQPGSRVPLHCTGLGKLLLAHLPGRTRKRVLERLKLDRYTDHTITDRDTLSKECDRIRKQGYAINDQEYHDGIISVAVPVHAENGNTISGLAIHAPAARLSIENAVALVPRLKPYADEIAGDLLED